MNEFQPQSGSIGQAEHLDKYLEQLLHRDRFRKAPGLRHLLQYLVQRAEEGKVDEIKESTIAMDVFGKSHDFDSRLDNIVRVQAHRLRKTLETYYEAEGAGDRFRISIPKGGYIPSIGIRDELTPGNLSVPVPVEAPAIGPVAPPVQPAPRILSKPIAVAGAFLAGSLLTLAAVWLSPLGHRAGGRQNEAAKFPLAAFWSGILDPAKNCVVSFTNPVFLWTGASRNRVFTIYRGPISAPTGASVDISPGDEFVDPDLVKQGGSFFFSEGWTGIGEVFGVHQLTQLFAEAGHPLKVIRSRALTYADLRESNVIFLGSPWANELQDKINPGRTPLACLGNGQITNESPRPGELTVYQAAHDAQGRGLSETYALISVLPGVTPGTKLISSAGLDTYGTSAGIEFLTSSAGVAELLQLFDPQQHKRLPPFFQAVIKCQIVRGDTARSDLVLVREVARKALVGEVRAAGGY